MNLTVDTPVIGVIGDNLLKTKSDYIFGRLSSHKSDISLKLNSRSDLLRKGSNCWTHRVVGNLEVSKFTAGIMKLAKKIELFLKRVITASWGMTILFSVLPGYLHSMGLCSAMTKRY